MTKSWTLLSMHTHIHSPVRQKLLLSFSLQDRKMRLGKLSELAQSHKAEIQTQVNKSKACVLCLFGFSLHTGQEMRDPFPPVGTSYSEDLLKWTTGLPALSYSPLTTQTGCISCIVEYRFILGTSVLPVIIPRLNHRAEWSTHMGCSAIRRQVRGTRRCLCSDAFGNAISKCWGVWETVLSAGQQHRWETPDTLSHLAPLRSSASTSGTQLQPRASDAGHWLELCLALWSGTRLLGTEFLGISIFVLMSQANQ